MSDPTSDNVHHVRREPLETEVAATNIGPLDSGEVPITVVNRDTRRAGVMAALRRLRTRVLIPFLIGAMAEWIVRQARRQPTTVAIAGATVVSTVIVSTAFALIGNNKPLAAPPAVVERVTLPPLPAVTHTITATAAAERTITLPPSITQLRSPAQARTPAPTPPQARPSAMPSQKPPPAISRPEIRTPETPPATPRQTETPHPRLTQRADAEPSRTPEQTQAPEQTRTPDASQTSDPTPPPETATTKQCAVRVNLDPLLDLCVLG